jgi:hypothetical protein
MPVSAYSGTCSPATYAPLDVGEPLGLGASSAIFLRPRCLFIAGPILRSPDKGSLRSEAVSLETRPGGSAIMLWHLRDRRGPADR